MRKRIWITCIVVLAVCLLLLLLKPTQHKKTTLHEQSEAPTNQMSQPEQAKAVKKRQTPDTSRTTTVQSVADIPKPTSETSNSAWERTLAIWQAPIEFYGKVLDENNNPVAGAKISFHWVEVPTEEGNRATNVESDAEGLFSLHGARGPDLSVSVVKEGYYPRRGGAKFGSFANETVSPDPHNPVIFNLRKKGKGVELITSENGIRLKVAVRVPKDNMPVRVDFLQKQASATGQLEISQFKPPWQEATEWSFRMSIPDGGFVENQDEFQFEATETNYQPTMEYHFTKAGTNWTTQVTKQFYIMFGQPRKYGWLRIESNLAQETIFLTYAINPSGSRNLEPSN